MAIRVVSWNIGKRHEPWRQLVDMDVDVALLQESAPPPEDVVRLRKGEIPPSEAAGPLEIGPREAWDSHSWNSDWWHGRGTDALFDRWPMVVRLSDRVEVEWFKQVGPTCWTEPDEVAVSGIGTVAVARVSSRDGSIEPFIAISMYARWACPHPSTNRTRWIYSDASAHRIISDLSEFIASTNPRTHRILAAGDLNLIYGSTDPALAIPARDLTVTDRMRALGMELLGPWHPSGRQAVPTPYGLPPDTRNVPTYYTTRQSPGTAQNQLDYVFASRGFHEKVAVRALNSVEEWGASDHCRLLIEVAG